MTIFLIVLQRLIKDKLSTLSSGLESKSTRYGYNNDLSTDLRSIIVSLEESIVRFAGTSNDELDTNTIIGMLDEARERVANTRELHNKLKDEGETVFCLNNLRNHTNAFLKKIKEAKIKLLLDRPYTMTPENIVYYHAAFYFGGDIFTPQSGIDVALRIQKETALMSRIKILSELIKPSFNLEEQREYALQTLGDLDSDNKRLIQGEKPCGIAIPWLTIWGAQVTAPPEWFSPREGRLAKEFNQATRDIKAMTESQFVQPEAQPEVSSVHTL